MSQCGDTRPQWVNNPRPSEFILGSMKIFAFSIISQHWDGTGSWNPSSWKTRTWSSMFNIMVADDLVTKSTTGGSALGENHGINLRFHRMLCFQHLKTFVTYQNLSWVGIEEPNFTKFLRKVLDKYHKNRQIFYEWQLIGSYCPCLFQSPTKVAAWVVLIAM